MRFLLRYCVWAVLLLPLCLSSTLATPPSKFLGPRLRITPDPVNFDTTFCMTTKCLTVTFQNTGDTALRVLSADAILPPFSGSIPAFTLNPNESRTFQVCYAPQSGVTVDSQRIVLQVDSLTSPNRRLSLLLKGSGVSPVIAVAPDLVDFYSTKVGTTSCQPVLITNTGNAPLTVASITGIVAPFTLQNVPSAPIAPGGSATVTVCFTPSALGFQQSNGLVTHNSCGSPPIALLVRGVGYSTSNQVLGPILEIAPKPLDFDSTLCQTTKCRDLAFSNLGDTALTVRSMPALPAPFSGSIPVPFTLNPAQTRYFPICYRPLTAPTTDQFQADLQADTRVSLSIGLLFDVSGSMTGAVSTLDATPRINAARNAGNVFITSLIDTLGIQDEAAVYAFSGALTVKQFFTTDKTLLHTAVTSLTAAGSTRLYASTLDVINAVALRSSHRVAIVLTDGEDNIGGATPTQVIAAANAGKVTVFTVGIGEANAAVLMQIATNTGGQFFSAKTTTDLIGVYRQIASRLSKNSTTSFTVQGRGVTPVMTLAQPVLHFDSVRVGWIQDRGMLCTNTGDAPLSVLGWTRGGKEFRALTPISIAPGATQPITISFAPDRLRLRKDTIWYHTNSCTVPDVPLIVDGIGWDSVTIALQGNYVTKPGSSFEIPVRLLDTLPAKYEVTSYTLTVGYNPTLLASKRASVRPEESGISTAQTLSSVFPGPGYSEAVVGDEARTTYTLAGGTLMNPVKDSVLARLSFLALLGNARSTTVRVTGVQFADGNPRVNVLQPALFSIDSLCWLDQRLLNPGGRIAGLLKQNVPNPFNPSTRIAFTLFEEGRARLAVLDAGGREVAVLIDEWRGKGEHEVLFDASSLGAGLYFYRLESGAWSDTKKMMLVK